MDNIPAELIKKGGSKVVNVLTTIHNMIWKTSRGHQNGSNLWLILSQRSQIEDIWHYRSVSLISYVRKFMLWVLLNCLIPKTKCILSEEQVGSRKERSKTKQVKSMWVILAKHIQQQTLILQTYTDPKKAFDWNYHEGLWKVMSDHNIEQNLVGVIKSLHRNSERLWWSWVP